jgi:hypothetical protein
MPCPPPRFAAPLLSFAPLLSERGWGRAGMLPVDAIPALGERTADSIPRGSGLARERRASWSTTACPAGRLLEPPAAARLLPGLLVEALTPDGPVVLGIDGTIARRRGRRIPDKGAHHDPVRSSRGRLVAAAGLRWLSLVLRVPRRGVPGRCRSSPRSPRRDAAAASGADGTRS